MDNSGKEDAASGKYIRYVQVLKPRERKGSLTGKFVCPGCGMKFGTQKEADGCCGAPFSDDGEEHP